MSDVTFSVDIEAPDITPYREGNTGIDFVTTLDSGRSGAHVMLSAVVHGNELCGAIALDYLMQRDVRPVEGKLTLAFMNVAAFETFDPANPTLSRYVDEDFNRLWTPAGICSAEAVETGLCSRLRFSRMCRRANLSAPKRPLACAVKVCLPDGNPGSVTSLAVLHRDEAGNLVRKAGVMAIVISGGGVAVGDIITTEAPLEYVALEPV